MFSNRSAVHLPWFVLSLSQFSSLAIWLLQCNLSKSIILLISTAFALYASAMPIRHSVFVRDRLVISITFGVLSYCIIDDVSVFLAKSCKLSVCSVRSKRLHFPITNSARFCVESLLPLGVMFLNRSWIRIWCRCCTGLLCSDRWLCNLIKVFTQLYGVEGNGLWVWFRWYWGLRLILEYRCDVDVHSGDRFGNLRWNLMSACHMNYPIFSGSLVRS